MGPRLVQRRVMLMQKGRPNGLMPPSPDDLTGACSSHAPLAAIPPMSTLHLSQCHHYDTQASKLFEDMASVSGHLASVLTSHWERLKIYSDAYSEIKIGSVVPSQQKELFKCLRI